MVRALGIDPGTRSFDLVVVDGEKVVWEKSIDTVEVAKNPGSLIKAVDEAGGVDLIAGPSGYGTPIVYNEDIVDPEVFAREVLLLTSPEDLERGVARGELGIAVYKAIVDVVKEFWRRKMSVCYIPSVVLLPTVPLHRKLNKLDMGTADKMAIAVLGVYEQSRRLNIGYEETSFILVEMGFGYNAAIAVKNGKIVDGHGGTLTPTGFLTIGPIDAELVVAGKFWERSDVFYGGVSTICGTLNPEEALKMFSIDKEPCRSAFKAMIESIVKTVKALTVSVERPREIILSGRLTRVETLNNLVKEALEPIAPIVKLQGLEGAKIAKEAAQGYAIIGEGIAGGFFKKLIEHMEIGKAKGTVMSWTYHPRLKDAKSRLIEAYRKSIRMERLKEILLD